MDSDVEYSKRGEKQKSQKKKLSFFENGSDGDDSEGEAVENFNNRKEIIKKVASFKRELDHEVDIKITKKPRVNSKLCTSVETDTSNDKLNKEQRLKEIRQQLSDIREQIADSEKKPLGANSTRGERMKKESDTLKKLEMFRTKLNEATKFNNSQSSNDNDCDLVDFEDLNKDLDKADGNDWLVHEFNVEKDVQLTKDAKTKTDDWYSIHDPRNPRNNRHKRREDRDHKYRGDIRSSSKKKNNDEDRRVHCSRDRRDGRSKGSREKLEKPTP